MGGWDDDDGWMDGCGIMDTGYGMVWMDGESTVAIELGVLLGLERVRIVKS